MTKVAQIEDRGAAVAWSPVGDHADVIALGAKVSESNYIVLPYSHVNAVHCNQQHPCDFLSSLLREDRSNLRNI